MTRTHKRWLTILSAVAIPALLYAVLAERASWRPRVWHVSQGCITSLIYSPDGQKLAVGTFMNRRSEVQLWDVGRQKLLQKFSVPKAIPAQVLFAPDGQRLAAAANILSDDKRDVRSTALLWDTRSGHLLHQWADGMCLHFDADGSQLLGMSDLQSDHNKDGKRSILHRWNSASGRETRRVTLDYKPYLGTQDWFAPKLILDYTPDGRQIVIAVEHDGSGATASWLFDCNTGQRVTVHKHPVTYDTKPFPPGSSVDKVQCSPDGKLIAFSGQIAALYDKNSGHLKHICEFSASTWELAFAPDGQTLAGICNKGVTLWDTGSGRLLRLIDRPTAPGPIIPPFATTLAFSPDGATLAAGGYNGTVKFWRIK